MLTIILYDENNNAVGMNVVPVEFYSDGEKDFLLDIKNIVYERRVEKNPADSLFGWKVSDKTWKEVKSLERG